MNIKELNTKLEAINNKYDVNIKRENVAILWCNVIF